jgi:glutaminyl-tRNA synthetase
MADAVVESTAKLTLDPDTGEFVSQTELKKRMKKRAKKAATAQKTEEQAKSTAGAKAPGPPKKKAANEDIAIEPDKMFKEGFLAVVYKERPTTSVVTRFPPEVSAIGSSRSRLADCNVAERISSPGTLVLSH